MASSVLPRTVAAVPSGPLTGGVLFARYAYPPNELGYCGPPDHRAVLEYASAGVADRGLVELARGFTGAWPYLQLIAATNGIEDPLDHRVVEAYWLGNALLENVDRTSFANSLRDRFRPRAGAQWAHVEELVPALAVPHHNFHVFGVYPWVGLLNSHASDAPLQVLNSCRIRWGQVVGVSGDRVMVRSRPLTWNGRELALGALCIEEVARSLDGYATAPQLQQGDWVAMHWHWVCDRLSTRQLGALRHYTQRQLDVTNHAVAHSGPAAILG